MSNIDNKRKKRVYVLDLFLLAVLAVVLGISMMWARDIEIKLGLLYYAEVDGSNSAQTPAYDVNYSADGAGKVDGGQLKIYYVDVGQGDCTVIALPDGKTMIVDAGKSNNSVKTAIFTFMQNTFGAQFKYFDYAILTHPDDDHCGGMSYVLDKYPARVCYRPNVEAVGTDSKPYTDPAGNLPKDKNTASYANAIKAMYAAADDFTPTVYVTDPADDSQTITGGAGDDKYTFTFYSPISDVYTDWNDYSPIMILSYRGFNFAMSGDAEKTNESEFVKKVNDARTDGIKDKYDIFTDSYTVNAIKCGHHGSRTSTSQGYIDAITTPNGARNAYYIISCGADNSYGHPHSETISRLEGMGVQNANILRTDVSGDIMLSVRASDNGVYGLFYGDIAARITEYMLVYKTIGTVKLTWATVAWTAYAVVVVSAAVHMFLICIGAEFDIGAKKGGRRR